MRKTLVTVAVAAGTYVLTNILNQSADEVWQLTVSIVIGGAALIVQYLVDFEERLISMERSLDEHHGEMRSAVDTAFEGINEATELYSQMSRSALRSDGVPQLVRSYTQVGNQPSRLVQDFAQEQVGGLTSLLENLKNGSVDCAGENNDWLIGLTICAKETIYATSTPVDRGFWYSEPANRYLKAQEMAIKQGVVVRRLFLVKEPHEVTPALEELCESHRDLGIDARIAIRSRLPQRARLTPTNDFIVFDGELSYETEPDVDVVPAKTLLRATPEHVAERVRRFNVLWEATEPVDPEGG
jgi:hypothetical protein